MTALYRPVLIESAEQAEALPLGTMAYLGEGATRHVAHKLQEDCWIRTDMGDLYSPAQDDCMCPGIFPDTWTALVPIEAEEETHLHIVRGAARTTTADLTRYVTPWGEA